MANSILSLHEELCSLTGLSRYTPNVFGTLSFGKIVVDDPSVGMTRPEPRKDERKKLVTEYLQTEYYFRLGNKRKEGSNNLFPS